MAQKKPLKQGQWKIKAMGNPYLTFLIGVALLVMFAMSFPRLDDLTWGSSVGLDRLRSWFAGYNGRYVGNLIVIILTRLPAVFRALVELGVLCAALYCAHCVLPNKGTFCFFILALLILPLELYAQGVVWTSGFANYATAAAVMLFELGTYQKIVIQNKTLSKGGYIVFFTVCFLGQMILENLAIYSILLAGGAVAYSWFSGEKKACRPLLAAMILTVCATAVVFLNSSYHSALAGDGGNYKEISLSLPELWAKFETEVVPWLVQKNHLLNLALSVVLLLLWLTRDAKGKGLNQNCLGCFCGALLSAFFCYDVMDSSWLNTAAYGKTAYALLALFYGAYIIVTIVSNAPDRASRLTLLTLALSQIALAGPLVPARPLTARCFFLNGILWCLLLAALLQLLLARRGLCFDKMAAQRSVARITQVICIFYLVFVLCAQSQSWHIQALRMDAIRSGVQQGAQTIVLPEVPLSGIYCYGANVGNDDYWQANYKRYYAIPEGVKVEFLNYATWCEQYGRK